MVLVWGAVTVPVPPIYNLPITPYPGLPPRVEQFPLPNSKLGRALLGEWKAQQQLGHVPPKGLLDPLVWKRGVVAPRGLLQPVGDVVKGPWGDVRGLLHSPDLLTQQQMQQGTGITPGAAPPRTGSPEWLARYHAKDPTLRPGSLQGVTREPLKGPTMKRAPEVPGRQKWRYEDSRGIEREGYIKSIYDDGRTYTFERPDGTLDVLSGSRLKAAQNITTMHPEGPVRTQLREQQRQEKFKRGFEKTMANISAKQAGQLERNKAAAEKYLSEQKSMTAQERMLGAIRAGSKVQYRDRFGNLQTGRAVMKGPNGWVLNMGGKSGRPHVLDPNTVISVTTKHPKGEE